MQCECQKSKKKFVATLGSPKGSISLDKKEFDNFKKLAKNPPKLKSKLTKLFAEQGLKF